MIFFVRSTDPNQHILDTLEQAIAVLMEKKALPGGGLPQLNSHDQQDKSPATSGGEISRKDIIILLPTSTVLLLITNSKSINPLPYEFFYFSLFSGHSIRKALFVYRLIGATLIGIFF